MADLQVGHALDSCTSQHGTPGVSGLTPGVSQHCRDYFFFFFAAFFVAKSLTPLRSVTLRPLTDHYTA